MWAQAASPSSESSLKSTYHQPTTGGALTDMDMIAKAGQSLKFYYLLELVLERGQGYEEVCSLT